MAERVGFEPTERFPVHSISSAASSTTPAPLQHCQLPISNCQLVHVTKLAIGNRKLAITWRRGWDSNPRWPLSHSGFRDRCTNPLCDLSASLFCSSAPEKFLHECAAFRLQHSGTDPDPVIQEIRIADAKATHHCSRSLIRRAIN